MSWHEGEGKAARIRVPPAVAYTKGRHTLGAVGQENAAVTTLDLTAQSGNPRRGFPAKSLPPEAFSTFLRLLTL